MSKQQKLRKGREKHIIHRNWIRLRNWIRKLFHLRSTPHQIALGFAIGAFIGIFPTFGLGFLVISAIAVFIKFNVPAAFIGTAIANPFLGPLWIFLSYKIGSYFKPFFHSDANIAAASGTMSKIFHAGLDYLVGNTLLSGFLALASYFIVLRMVIWIEEKKNERREKYSLNKH